MCPNIGECWEEREATFLILGDEVHAPVRVLRRHDRQAGPGRRGARPDRRDRRADGPALRRADRRGPRRPARRRRGVWAASDPRHAGRRCPVSRSRSCPSDFKGGERDIATVLDAEPDVFAHNLETVPPAARPDPSGVRLRAVARGARVREAPPRRAGDEVEPDPRDGRTAEEVRAGLRDLRDAGVDIVTMGQYLQPTPQHLPGRPMGRRPRSSPSTPRVGRGDGDRARRGRPAGPLELPRGQTAPRASSGRPATRARSRRSSR